MHLAGACLAGGGGIFEQSNFEAFKTCVHAFLWSFDSFCSGLFDITIHSLLLVPGSSEQGH